MANPSMPSFDVVKLYLCEILARQENLRENGESCRCLCDGVMCLKCADPRGIMKGLLKDKAVMK